jgi:uncharacterized membrane protein
MVLFTLLAPFVSAYSNVGMELSKERVSGCPGYAIPVDLTLTNNDDVTHTYALSLEMPEGWKVPDNGFIQPDAVLASGESKKVTFWVNPPAVAQGVYNVKIKAKAGMDENARNLEVEVLRCHDVAINVLEKMEVCADSNFKYAFSVANNGKATEEFDVIVTASWGAELYRESVVIEAGKSNNFALNLTSPAQSGQITAKAVSKTSYTKDEKTTQLDVSKCYDFSIGLEPKEASACLGASSKFVLTVKNLGTAGDVYVITAPAWVVASQGNATLLSGEERSIDIFAYPEIKGKTTFELSVASKSYPKLEKKLTAAVEAKECKGVAVILSPLQEEICKGLPVVFKVTVKNTGMAADSYELQTNFGNLGTDKMNIDTGEIKETELIIDTKDAEIGEKLVTIVVKSGDISDQNSAQLKIKNCYAADFAISPEKAEVCSGDDITYTLALKNTGEFDDNYTISLNGETIGDVALTPGELSMFSTQLKMGFPEGAYNLTFSIKSDQITKDAVSVITVKPGKTCYNLEISSEGAASMVEPGKGIAIAVKLRNSGEKPDDYVLDLGGPSWAHLSQEAVSLEAGEETYVYLYASPGYDIEKNIYNVSLTARSENVEKETIFRLGVGVTPEQEPSEGTGGETGGVSIPTGGIITLTGTTGKVILLAIIVLLIIIILAVKFVLFVK